MTKRIFIARFSVIILLTLLVVVNCTHYHSSATIPQERQDSANIIQESPEMEAEPHARLKAKATETLKGFAGGFLENTGQKNTEIYYYARSSRLTVGFGVSQLWFSISGIPQACPELEPIKRLWEEECLQECNAPTIVGITFPGSAPVTPRAATPTGAYSNFYLGADPTQWSTHNPYYEKLLYPNLYEHIDLVYELHEGQLKYEFIVRPGGSPDAIRVRWHGPIELAQQAAGLQITIETATGPFQLTDSTPLSYHVEDSSIPVPSAFLLEDAATYGFSVGAYDPTRPLTIDPFISTFLGGSGDEGSASPAPWDYGLAVDATGNVWVTGFTYDAATNFPTTPDALNQTHNGERDVFLAQITPDGSTLLYSTFFGGTQSDLALTLALDNTGNVWLGGQTTSTDLPTTTDALNTSKNGDWDAFLAQLAADGSTLLYSTYLGGDLGDAITAIAFDAGENVWIAGHTNDHATTDFPVTNDALNTTHNGPSSGSDIFIAQLTADGSTLLYSTLLGGNGFDEAYVLAIDEDDNVWVAGATYAASLDFPTTVDALNTTNNSDNTFADVFLLQLAADKTKLLYSTLLGGQYHDRAYDLALDAVGNVWFTGLAYDGTPRFPTTSNAINSSYNGGPSDVFVAQLAADGSALLYSTFLGGAGSDQGHALALDAAGDLWVTGATSANFPATPDAVNTTDPGGWDGFIAQLAANGSALLYSTYLGGDANDMGHDLAVDGAGNVWVTGYTVDHATTDFPTSPGAYDTTHNGGIDVFLFALMPPSSPQALSAEFSGTNTVILTWSPPTTPGSAPVTIYRIYRSTSSGVIGVLVAETPNTTYTDVSSLVPGIPYYYVLTAVSSIGESLASNEAAIGLIVPSSPQSLTAAAGSGHTVLLVWVAPIPNIGPSITTYRVYRSTTLGLIGTLLANTTTTAFNDSTVVLGNEYFYVVTAVNSIGEGSPSKQFRIAFTAPSAPQQLSITVGPEHTAILTWTAPVTEGSTSLIAYRVYRSTNSSVYGAFLAESPNTTFTDASLDSGVSYYFVVTAVNSNGESPMSNEAAVILSATIPGAPGNLSAVPDANFVILSWLPSTTDGGSPIISYRVYRGTTSGNYLFLGGSTSTTFNDTTAVGGLTYYYAVRAVNRIGESSYSNEVSAAPLILPITTDGSESTTATTPGFLTIVNLLSFSAIWLWRRKKP